MLVCLYLGITTDAVGILHCEVLEHANPTMGKSDYSEPAPFPFSVPMFSDPSCFHRFNNHDATVIHTLRMECEPTASPDYELTP